jgi:hypothetical protein
MMKMSSKTDELVPLIREIYSRLFTEILSESDGEDAKFFNNTETVMYWSSPVTSSMMAATKEVLLREDNPMGVWLVNPEIAATYLNTGELGLVGAFSGDLESGIVGAFDRSTGIGLYYNKDWLSMDDLKDEIDAALDGETYDMVYVEVIPRPVNSESKQAERSVVRLRNLLADCRSHQLTTACGFEVQLADSES